MCGQLFVDIKESRYLLAKAHEERNWDGVSKVIHKLAGIIADEEFRRTSRNLEIASESTKHSTLVFK